MNTEFIRILSSSQNDRRDLFFATANRLGTTLQNVEKDFWVCLVLDVLFNGRDPSEPRLLFKGGTSLSKAYGLISRFSEDLDITVFREDIGQHVDIENMISLSGKQQRIRLNAIKQACQEYIQGPLKNRLNRQISALLRDANTPCINDPVISDPDDPAEQTLLVNYPTVNTEVDPYVKSAVKIEAGAKSALEPHQLVSIKPYLAEDVFRASLTISNIVTINAERTFWDKVIILHGLRRWHDHRGQLRQQGHRISRHYYDVYKLMHSSVGKRAQNNRDLAFDCAQHAQLFFNSKDLDLSCAHPGSFTIMPTPAMMEPLKQDYKAMAGMIFGEAVDFSMILETILQLEKNINRYLL
ncbi:MAG: hypothetical protein A3E82_05360 [Gammaproteobacteria bacterium RIFCSPHIGHO2_12_FULL_38_11]|nr:MAG: hypothetical protein A3E82_05360 [Gammaproteobacteria bacterium RIFCSPHIGHO2_12_FULL_38_11]